MKKKAHAKKGKRMAMGGRPEMGRGMGNRSMGVTGPGRADMRGGRRGAATSAPDTATTMPVSPAPTDKMAFTRPGVSTPMPKGGVSKPALVDPLPSGGAISSPANPGITPVSSTPMPRGGMRGGGLAKKGVGQALAKGGLVKGAGCAQRGVKKPRYT